MRVYLAARYRRREEMLLVARALEAKGHRVTSRWISGAHEAVDGVATPELRWRFAEEDLEDLRGAEVLIAFTEREGSPYGRGGRHVEYGVALEAGKGIILVGPAENVFYCDPGIARFEHTAAFLTFLGRLEPGAYLAWAARQYLADREPAR